MVTGDSPQGDADCSLSSEEVSRQVQRLLAGEQFRKAQRLRHLLEYIVGCLNSGRIDQLREYNIAIDVFQRRPSFDQRMDPIVRVEASRLRAKLRAYYEGEGKDDPVIIELPSGTYIPAVFRRPDAPRQQSEPTGPTNDADTLLESPEVIPLPRKRRRFPMTVAVAAAVILLALAAAFGVVRLRSHTEGVGELTRVTSDSGLTAYPALSRDGRLLAYSSDRVGSGHLSIWVETLDGGRPVRLTGGDSDDQEADFSPDGSELAFRSEREGGGIFAVPVLGRGEPRLLARQGRRPRYSPHGDFILYWTRDEDSGAGQIFRVPSQGGTPRRLAPEFADAHHPVWSADGLEILFCGTREVPSAGGNHDWWVIPKDGGSPRKTGADEALLAIKKRKAGDLLRDLPYPAEWTARGVLFSARQRNGEDLYLARFAISDSQVAPAPLRLTASAGLYLQPRTAAGRLVFLSASMSSSIWILPLRTPTNQIGAATKLTSNLFATEPSVSADGRYAVFVSETEDGQQIYLKDLTVGTESPLTAKSGREQSPKISPDGKMVAYCVREEQKQMLYVQSTGGGNPQKVCEDCGRPTAWSPDQRYLLFIPRARGRTLEVLDLTTGKRFELVRHETARIRSAAFSHDGTRIAFDALSHGQPPQMYVVPFRAGTILSGRDWVALGAGQAPTWSHDGRWIYFLSDRDGFRCIWAQRMAAQTAVPEGKPTVVRHFHEAARSLLVNLHEGAHDVGLTAVKDKLIFAMDQMAGNIWMTDDPTRR